MYSTIACLHNEAFTKPSHLEIGLSSDFFVDDYAFGLRTQGIGITRYTSGDTWFQPETPLVLSALTALPSKISKRYSPQKREQNTGMPLPPEPQFMKQNSDKTEKITSIREIIRKEAAAPEYVVSKSTPIPGIDFARTSSDAAALLERLGKPVTYEAHQTYVSSKPMAEEAKLVSGTQTQNHVGVQSKLVDVPANERIVIDRKTYRQAGQNGVSSSLDNQPGSLTALGEQTNASVSGRVTTSRTALDNQPDSLTALGEQTNASVSGRVTTSRTALDNQPGSLTALGEQTNASSSGRVITSRTALDNQPDSLTALGEQTNASASERVITSRTALDNQPDSLTALGEQTNASASERVITSRTASGNHLDSLATPDLQLEQVASIPERIVISRVPEKTFEHVNLSPVGHEIESLPNQVDSIRKAQSLEQQVQTSRQEQDPSSTTYITSGLRKKPNDSVSINHVIVDAAQIETPNVEVMNQSVESQTIVASREQQRKSQSPNLITITENRLVHNQNNTEIEDMSDAPQVVRRVIEDFAQMKESQQQERTMQMQSVEDRVMKIVKEELPQEIDSKVEATNEIKEIIREVIRAHPDSVQRSINSDDMEYTFASRDAFLRVQIEQELRDKFESRLVENNKMMEKKNKLLFEEMLDRFLNP